MGFPGGSGVKNLQANAGDIEDTGSRRSPGEGTRNPLFLPGKPYGQRSLVSYSPWGHRRVGHDLATKQQQHLNLLNFAKHSCTCISVSTTTSCVFVLEDD